MYARNADLWIRSVSAVYAGTCYPASIIKLDEDVKKATEKAERDFEKSIFAKRHAFIVLV